MTHLMCTSWTLCPQLLPTPSAVMCKVKVIRCIRLRNVPYVRKSIMTARQSRHHSINIWHFLSAVPFIWIFLPSCLFYLFLHLLYFTLTFNKWMWWRQQWHVKRVKPYCMWNLSPSLQLDVELSLSTTTHTVICSRLGDLWYLSK